MSSIHLEGDMDYVILIPIMYDVVLDELNCFEIMDSQFQIATLVTSVIIWNIIGITVYCCMYNRPDVDGDSVQYTLKFLPAVKALQMTLVLVSLLLCARDNFLAILVQNFVMMLDLACETAQRTAYVAILYLIASVRIEIPLVNILICSLGMGNIEDAVRVR